jgi:Transmembrane amino acid transporter protein
MRTMSTSADDILGTQQDLITSSPEQQLYSSLYLNGNGDVKEAIGSDASVRVLASSKKESSVVALLHIVCFTAGVGVLNLPKVVAEAGWLSLILFPLVAVVVDYTSKRIISCLYIPPRRLEEGEEDAEDLRLEASRQLADSIEDLKMKHQTQLGLGDSRSLLLASGPFRMDGLPEVGEAAFGKPGYIVVHIFHKIVLLGICVVFLVLAGDAVQQLFSGIVHLAQWHWILILTGLLAIPVLFLKGMQDRNRRWQIWYCYRQFFSTCPLEPYATRYGWYLICLLRQLCVS